MATQQPSISVRLLFYSGRPDPEGTLEGDAAEALTERMRKTLQSEKIHPAPVGGLGYKGFLVRNEGKMPDLPAELLSFYGVLTEDSGPRATHRRDSGGVEEFLLAQARSRGFAQALDSLGVGPTGLL